MKQKYLLIARVFGKDMYVFSIANKDEAFEKLGKVTSSIIQSELEKLEYVVAIKLPENIAELNNLNDLAVWNIKGEWVVKIVKMIDEMSRVGVKMEMVLNRERNG